MPVVVTQAKDDIGGALRALGIPLMLFLSADEFRRKMLVDLVEKIWPMDSAGADQMVAALDDEDLDVPGFSEELRVLRDLARAGRGAKTLESRLKSKVEADNKDAGNGLGHCIPSNSAEYDQALADIRQAKVARHLVELIIEYLRNCQQRKCSGEEFKDALSLLKKHVASTVVHVSSESNPPSQQSSAKTSPALSRRSSSNSSVSSSSKTSEVSGDDFVAQDVGVSSLLTQMRQLANLAANSSDNSYEAQLNSLQYRIQQLDDLKAMREAQKILDDLRDKVIAQHRLKDIQRLVNTPIFQWETGVAEERRALLEIYLDEIKDEEIRRAALAEIDKFMLRYFDKPRRPDVPRRQFYPSDYLHQMQQITAEPFPDARLPLLEQIRELYRRQEKIFVLQEKIEKDNPLRVEADKIALAFSAAIRPVEVDLAVEKKRELESIRVLAKERKNDALGRGYELYLQRFDADRLVQNKTAYKAARRDVIDPFLTKAEHHYDQTQKWWSLLIFPHYLYHSFKMSSFVAQVKKALSELGTFEEWQKNNSGVKSKQPISREQFDRLYKNWEVVQSPFNPHLKAAFQSVSKQVHQIDYDRVQDEAAADSKYNIESLRSAAKDGRSEASLPELEFVGSGEEGDVFGFEDGESESLPKSLSPK